MECACSRFNLLVLLVPTDEKMLYVAMMILVFTYDWRRFARLHRVKWKNE